MVHQQLTFLTNDTQSILKIQSFIISGAKSISNATEITQASNLSASSANLVTGSEFTYSPVAADSRLLITVLCPMFSNTRTSSRKMIMFLRFEQSTISPPIDDIASLIAMSVSGDDTESTPVNLVSDILLTSDADIDLSLRVGMDTDNDGNILLNRTFSDSTPYGQTGKTIITVTEYKA